MRRVIAVLPFVLVTAASLLAGDAFQSGLQPGEMLPGTFEPLNITGEYVGQKHCLVCEYGLDPVVMIFARDVSEPLLHLVRKVDAAAGAHKAHSLSSFVVFLNDREGLDRQVAEAARKHAVKHVVLAIDAPPGPEGYRVATDADVTVVLYNKAVVKANHAFKKGELTEAGIGKVLADLPKMLPAK